MLISEKCTNPGNCYTTIKSISQNSTITRNCQLSEINEKFKHNVKKFKVEDSKDMYITVSHAVKKSTQKEYKDH